ncbi:alcohol dehydogenase [Trametes sanguinea]|nr:alcohol dehydogenase [Trametes sanguinea]
MSTQEGGAHNPPTNNPTEPVRDSIPSPYPDADEVLVKVLAAGVCHSDVHLFMRSTTKPFHPHVYTLGHEGAGTIVSLGDKVAADPALSKRFALGTYVAINPVNACHSPQCDSCSRGFENACYTFPKVGLNMDGSWAEYVKVRPDAIVPVPENDPQNPRLQPGVVAAATDAVLTSWHAIMKTGAIKPDETLLIVGCGGLGLNAIQIAKRVLGVRTVIASDIREDSLVLARESGADHAAAPTALRALLKEQGVRPDVVLDLVGKQETLDLAIGLLRVGGRIVWVGLGDAAVSFRPLFLGQKQISIHPSLGGDNASLEDCLGAIAEGKLTPSVEERPMSECAAVLHGLEKGEIRARVALIP